MKTNQLQPEEYPPYFGNYISQVSSEYSLIEELEISVHRYSEGKWTIKDILQHLIDAERIFAYRALRFSRNDQTPLATFDEDEFVVQANANRRSIQDLLTELAVVRQASLSLFKSFSEEELLRIGTASGKQMSVRALGIVIIGHQNHHQRVFEERYL